MMRVRRFLLSVVLMVLLAPTLLWAQTAADVDFDGSGTIDFPDFVAFARAFGSDQARFDLDGNGTVNFTDFLVFASFFGQTVPAAPPLADAGPDQGIDIKNTVALDGSASSGGQSDSLQFTWTQVFGDPVTLTDSTAVQPSFIPPSPGNYAFQLIVSDGAQQSAPDTAIINVVALSENAVLMGGEDATLTYQSVSGNRLTLNFTGASSGVEEGAVLVNTEEPYFLRRVVRIVKQEDQRLTVETEDAVLTDVLEEASITATFRTGQPAGAKLALPAQVASSSESKEEGLGITFTEAEVRS
ncbi:MAG: PKD domain-containing protein, partial [bacterium]|nr:PKD domain-containing protein [bacterium]